MKRILCALLSALLLLTLTACGNQSDGDSKDAAFDDAYAVADVTLCGTNTNDASFMKGFSMQGTAGDLINNENVFSIAMCYSTATLDDVKAFFTSERFSDPDSFLAEIDALDLDGNIRNLSGDKMSYFDGNTADPIRFYGDGVDLINGTSLLQQAGEYHFYLVTIGYEKVLLTYNELKEIVENTTDYELWQTALSAINAVYLIVDMETGSQYVGSAYGKDGLRWRFYVDSLHGNNKLMKDLICNHPDRYKHFQFSILQILSKSTPDEEIIHAEALWKKKLCSVQFGMNDN